MDPRSLPDKLPEVMGKPWSLPPHVFHRLQALLLDEEVVYLDGEVDSADRAFSGRIVALTSARVVVAELRAAAQLDPNNKSTFSVDVATWARRDLRSLSVESREDGRQNPDDAWGNAASERWPHEARLTLTFEGQPPLVLPLNREAQKPQRAALYALLPELVADLQQR